MLINILLVLMPISTPLTGDLTFFCDYDIIQTFNDSFSFQCFYNIPYNKLFFTKSSDMFYGKYQTSIELWDKDNLIAAKISTNEFTIKDYEETKETNKFNLDSMIVKFTKSKEYNTKLLAKILISDLNSKYQGISKFTFELPYINSRIRFYSNNNPNPQRVYSTDPGINDTFIVTCEIYTDSVDNCSLWIAKEYGKINISKSGSTQSQNKSVLYEKFYPIEKLINNKHSLSNKFVFFYPLGQITYLDHGQHLCIVAGYNQSQKKIFEIIDSFTINKSFFYSESEYLEMVNRVLYIASEEDIRYLKQIPPSKRNSAWYDFWKPHDPSPTTTINESEQEYFTRIDYCVNNFSKGDKGYRSDRARIFMKYDKPDFIETRPFEQYSYAYEIWYYYNIGRQFIFTDAHGFGEYTLYQEKRI
jgi:GWxTD domain-containing protein